MKKCLSQLALCGCLMQAALAAQPPVAMSEPMAPPIEALRMPPAGQGGKYLPASVSADTSGNELSYSAYIDSPSRLRPKRAVTGKFAFEVPSSTVKELVFEGSPGFDYDAQQWTA